MEQVPNPTMPVPSDAVRKCPTCTHWHPALIACNTPPHFNGPHGFALAVSDLGFMVEALGQQIQLQGHIIDFLLGHLGLTLEDVPGVVIRGPSAPVTHIDLPGGGRIG